MHTTTLANWRTVFENKQDVYNVTVHLDSRRQRVQEQMNKDRARCDDLSLLQIILRHQFVTICPYTERPSFCPRRRSVNRVLYVARRPPVPQYQAAGRPGRLTIRDVGRRVGKVIPSLCDTELLSQNISKGEERHVTIWGPDLMWRNVDSCDTQASETVVNDFPEMTVRLAGVIPTHKARLESYRVSSSLPHPYECEPYRHWNRSRLVSP